MKLSDLFLNRFLYRDNSQSLETKDAAFESADSSDSEPTPIPSGGAAQDINMGNVTINGQQLTPGTYPVTVLDVSNWGWGQTCAFSSTDLDTVAWGAGTFTSASGVSYSISAGNTGNMAAKTYIYLDLLVSLTAYQITTTPANAVGVGKVLVAVAVNASAGNLATYNLSEATQIVGDNILANSINASKITTGQLVVGTNVGLGSAQDSAGVTTIVGNTVTTSYVNALSVTAGSVAAENISGTTITGKTFKTSASGHRVVIDGSSDDITFYNSSGDETIFIDGAGTTAGYSQMSIGGGIRLSNDVHWDHQYYTEIYSGAGDSTNFVIHPIGYEDAYFFFSSKGDFDADRDITAGGNISADNFSGSSSGTNTGDSSGHSSLAVKSSLGDYTYDGSYTKVSSTGLTVKGSNGLYLSGANKIEFSSYTLTMNSNKTAIIPTSEGFNALYCMESPEVWFMDFCDEPKKLDPMFEEVTVAPYHYIKCESGGYQVWGKRKGHENYRFESKTLEEYIANEKFLNMNKPIK
jgi:hypothetical protein